MKQLHKLKLLVLGLSTTMAIAGCSKDRNSTKDTEYPTIDVTSANAFPKQCSELLRGQKLTAKIIVSDNAELGSVSIDVHQNFDHHSHSTEVSECDMEAIKTPVTPFLLTRPIAVPAGSKSYTATTEIEIPADVDAGDYHFMIRVTDKEGWQTIKGLSVKIK